MQILGANVTLTSAVGDDWDYVFKMCAAQATHNCLPELLPEMARRHCFVAFIVTDKQGQRLGIVHSNHLEEINGYTVDLYVETGNSGYIRECFDLFTIFMAQVTDRLYGYIHKDDEKILRLGEVFGFSQVGTEDDFVITMREI